MAITVKTLAEIIKNCKGFDQFFNKIKFISAGSGSCVAELKVEPEHSNSFGGLHGGLSATLVDSVTTYALLTHKNGEVPSVSVDIHTTYLKSAKVGDTILIDASTLRVGRNLAFLQCDIKNKETGDLLVKGSHTKYLMRPL